MDKANWNKFNALVEFPATYTDPSEDCVAISSSLFEAAVRSVPRKCPTTRRSAHWWTPECTTAKRTMHAALTQYRNHLGSSSLWINYKRERARFRLVLASARTASWQQYLSSITADTPSSAVWHKIHCLRKKPSPRSIVLLEQGSIISSPAEVARIFCEYFAAPSPRPLLFRDRQEVAEAVPVVFSRDNSALYNSPLTYLELTTALSGSTSRSPGPDKIPYQFLKQLLPEHQLQLLKFLNFVFNSGYPEQWREGEVLPIPKPQKAPSQKSSFRPITLTNCLSKLYGKMITRRLQCHLESINFYNPTQSGFRAGHSTLDGLCRLENSARNAILLGHHFVAVFLDISKAFDSVWHHGLLMKLAGLGLAGNLAQTISSFLTNRRIAVRVATTRSSHYDTTGGVPQGSVLSPTLFTIFINDMFDGIPECVQTSLYADDGALWVTAPTLDQALGHMQRALDVVVSWTHSWGLTLSTAKTQAMVFTNRRVLSPLLSLDAQAVPFVSHTKYLGIIFDSRLTWRRHIAYVHARCLSDLNLLRVVAASRYGADFLSLRRLYIALTLPKLDYGSFLFATAAPCHLIRLARIQFAASRIIVGALRCTRTSLLEAEADLLPLHIRRQQLMLLYGSRIAAIPHHPVRAALLRFQPHHVHLQGNYLLSAVARLYDGFQQTQILPLTIPTLPMSTRYSFSTLPVHDTLNTVQKSARNAPQWQSEFYNLHASCYKTRTMVFTDGSHSVRGSGCAVWSDHFQLVARLPADASVFTAELYAIFMALQFLKTSCGQFVIYTDSLSAVTALQTLRRSSHYLLSRILTVFGDLPEGKVLLEWVPSHMGIGGNEMADRLAGQSISLSRITNVQPSNKELRHLILRNCHSTWSAEWAALPPLYGGAKQELGLPPYLQLPRHQQVPLARLRLHCSQISHGHHIRRCQQPLCPPCQVPLTHEHFLVICPLLDHLRCHLRTACHQLQLPFGSSSLLQGGLLNPLVDFLEEADFLRRL